jgi:hypothetical protein
MIGGVTDPTSRPAKGARADSREVAELKALRGTNPELADAIDMHVELLELQRRIQGRVPLPSMELSQGVLARHTAEGRPILRFEDIPLDLTDLRLTVRQTADIMRRFDVLEDADYQRVQSLGRDMRLVEVVGDWYRRPSGHQAVASVGPVGSVPGLAVSEAVTQVLALAMRPFLCRCAEVLQQRSELASWPHAFCALCGGEPDFAVITPAAERHLICSRCALRWRFEPLTCPYCQNRDRTRITSFATTDGKYRVYACDVCRRYLKAYDGRRATRPVIPVVDAVATLPLDAAAIQRGYS